MLPFDDRADGESLAGHQAHVIDLEVRRCDVAGSRMHLMPMLGQRRSRIRAEF